MSRKLVLPNLALMTSQALTNTTASLIANCSNLDYASIFFKVTGTSTVPTTVTVYVCQDAAGTNAYPLPGLSASIAAGDTDMEIYLNELPFSYIYVKFSSNATDTTVHCTVWFNGKVVGA